MPVFEQVNGAAVDYEFDVFVSYRRSAGNVGDWVHHHFYPVLKRCLEDEAGTGEIFVDRQMEGNIGDSWPDQLADSLGKSRLLVPVLSAPYFRSPWCIAEWATMAAREERERRGRSNALILPVVFADGVNFPEYVQERELHEGFKNYNVPYPEYRKSEAYPYFHREVQGFARQIAGRLTKVPDWREDWPALRPPADAPVPSPKPDLGAT
ncbi:toll/interleukin-1 receptor domain-containing protein [Streptomyces sp. SID13726]|uniref:TIR domain-containing protein n=1 Tax=Streptomyces sp. SID13726 TaxID=2706058 RepID=UPI0013B78A98|nr:toll/interleukin-1 receptor domain-containing protein [Streptomyces sp. SID13726]